MTKKQFDAAYRAFCRRRPFRPFSIEFTSSNQLLIAHSEAILGEAGLYTMRRADGGHEVFAVEEVYRFLDPPTPTAK